MMSTTNDSTENSTYPRSGGRVKPILLLFSKEDRAKRHGATPGPGFSTCRLRGVLRQGQRSFRKRAKTVLS